MKDHRKLHMQNPTKPSRKVHMVLRMKDHTKLHMKDPRKVARVEVVKFPTVDHRIDHRNLPHLACLLLEELAQS